MSILADLNSFPREDESAPRQVILRKFCPEPMGVFRACMSANDYNENKCLEPKGILDKCASAAFKNCNSDPNATF